MTITADLAPDQQISRLLPPGFSEYRSVIVFNRDGHLTAATFGVADGHIATARVLTLLG